MCIIVARRYKPRRYFWESLVLLRKFALVAVAVFLDNAFSALKLLLSLAIVQVAMIGAIFQRPYW